MPIRAVTFDADDTLWDFQTVVGIAIQRVIDRLIGTAPDLGFDVDASMLMNIHARVRQESAPGSSYAVMRRQSIRQLVNQTIGDDERLAGELGDLFFAVRDAEVKTFDDVETTLDRLHQLDIFVGVITNGNTTWKSMAIADHFDFWLAADQIGVRKPDPRIFEMAAAAAECRIRDLVHVGDEASSDVVGVQKAGGRAIFIDRRRVGTEGTTPDAVIDSLHDLVDVITTWNREETDDIGVGPHTTPWPDDPRLDPVLLTEGDRRNVEDRFRYWRIEAIVTELDRTRHGFHVAIENWHHDRNIGTVVRTANAFGAGAVHIVGHRRWDKRGAMVTDRYQHVHHHEDAAQLAIWAQDAGLRLIGIDNFPGAKALEGVSLPKECVLVFGQERGGLSPAMRQLVDQTYSITQFGSTRSLNAAVAAGIAMHSWVLQHGQHRLTKGLARPTTSAVGRP